MSRVWLIAADKPLPLCEHQIMRTKRLQVGDIPFTVSVKEGFAVRQLTYYRDAVDELGYEMKPYQYEMELCQDFLDLDYLREYLKENFSEGESVELWSFWVGDGQEGLVCYRGSLEEFDLETMGTLDSGGLEQVCITVEI